MFTCILFLKLKGYWSEVKVFEILLPCLAGKTKLHQNNGAWYYFFRMLRTKIVQNFNKVLSISGLIRKTNFWDTVSFYFELLVNH